MGKSPLSVQKCLLHGLQSIENNDKFTSIVPAYANCIEIIFLETFWLRHIKLAYMKLHTRYTKLHMRYKKLAWYKVKGQNNLKFGTSLV